MYGRRLFVLCLALFATLGRTALSAQESHQHADHPSEQGFFVPREASGTSWVPDATPMYGIHQQAGPWQLMWHGNVFGQFLYESGERGNEQAGSINWFMAMARRNVASGQFGLRGMLSLEPATIPGCGYPDLLATGEVCDGEVIHDRQHPHDLFMELAAEYSRPIRGALRWQVYGGFAGEPALGPAAYPHRMSSLPNPLAPISHHWLDATHITFGVVTGAIHNARWKAEASLFNGREPDENRWNIDLASLDSVSGRVWFAPTSTMVFQVSAGQLTDAEAGHDGEGRVDVTRLTASATFHRQLGENRLWATTAAWGRNDEGDESTNAFLLETDVNVEERDNWFGRFEITGKSAHDLDIHGSDEVFTVGKLQAGYTRYLPAWRGLKPGFGGSLSFGFVPKALGPVYGSRINSGFGVFVTLRPDAHRM
jgi:hypothetical protein